MTGTIKIYNIYYGDFTTPNQKNTSALIDYFAANLGSSQLFQIMNSYYNQPVVNGAKTFVTASTITFAKSVFYEPTARGLTITVTSIKTMMEYLFNTNVLIPDSNAIYMIMFRGDFSFATKPNYAWGQQWCGYHTGFYLGSSRLFYKYAVMGDTSTAAVPGNCAEITNRPTVNKNLGGDSLVNIYGHELTEVISNPTASATSNSWLFDPSFNLCDRIAPCENADVCSWNFGVDTSSQVSNVVVGKKQFLVQQFWQPGIALRIIYFCFVWRHIFSYGLIYMLVFLLKFQIVIVNN